jgi:hypothetical protein
MHVAFEVLKIVGFLPPASLTLCFADVVALVLGAVALAPDIAVVGMKAAFTVQIFTLSSGVCHRPGSPWAYDANMALGKEENRQEKWDEETVGKRSKKGMDIKGEGRIRNGLIYNFKPATGELFLVAADICGRYGGNRLGNHMCGRVRTKSGIAQARLAITHGMHEVVRAVDLVFHAAGTNAVYRKHPLVHKASP